MINTPSIEVARALAHVVIGTVVTRKALKIGVFGIVVLCLFLLLLCISDFLLCRIDDCVRV